MLRLLTSKAMQSTEFQSRLLTHLRVLCNVDVDLDAELFSTGLVNSMKFIELMAFVETALGIEVPNNRLSAEFFKTPRVIVNTFSKDGVC
jgi:acyl carrier protein